MYEIILSLFMNLLLIFPIKTQEISDFSVIDNYNSSYEFENLSSGKSSRFLKPSFLRPSLLNIVRFPNEECFDASNQSGTCYTAFECKKLGGLPSSPCARGLGACCIVSRSCHNATTNRVVYFKNPSYPQSDTQQNFCDLTVNIVDADVCQLRLDFMDFQLDQPTLGDCLGDKFRISASGFAPTSVPILCGLNRNQHIYVSLPRDLSDRSASIVFETNNVGDYRWHIRITQIDCNWTSKRSLLSDRTKRGFSTAFVSNFPGIQAAVNQKFSFLNDRSALYSLPAPQGCLQYFTSPIGTVESFNFGEYLNNMDYAICIERQPNTCRVIYSASDYQWSIDSNTNDNSLSAVGDNQCESDYLMIPAASQTGDSPTFDRYCGGRLYYITGSTNEAPVISKANGPIVLRFRSDNIHDQTARDGFRLRYEQSSSECMPQLSNLAQTINNNQPSPVAANLLAQYLVKQVPSFSLEKQEPIIHFEKNIESNARLNAKKLRI